MKKISIYRIIWVLGIVLILIVILFMFIQYKMTNKKDQLLYIYTCQVDEGYESLCTTTEKNNIEEDKIISTYNCRGDGCPTIESIINNEEQIIILIYEDESRVLFDVQNNKVISEKYKDYYIMIDNNQQIIVYVVQTQDDNYQLINQEGKLITNEEYKKIGYIDKNVFNDYNDQYITAIKNDKYGVIEIATGNVIVDFKYDELHINGTAIISVKDNLLYLIDREGNNLFTNGYSYIYGLDDIYVTIKNKELNIIDNEETILNDTPVTIYDDYVYNDSSTFHNISVYKLENYIYINITNGDEYIEYEYDITTQELKKV